MKREVTLKVDESSEGLRLDLFIPKVEPKITRSLAKKVIDSNKVKVNGKLEYRANYKVRAGDEITFGYQSQNNENIIPEDIKLDIIYEDEGLVVVNKPVGMSSHPSAGSTSRTLVNALLFKYKELQNVGDRIKSGLIHRLDKETSGIILVGKSNDSVRFYSTQFANREVDKIYLAISRGKLTNNLLNNGTQLIQTFIGRNPKNRKKMTNLKDGSNGKFAITKIDYLESNGANHLFKIQIMTGRTHQIRVHMSSIGLPILGDNVYGGDQFIRLMLHSYNLRIKSQDNKLKNFVAPIPKEFQKIFPKINEIITNSKIK